MRKLSRERPPRLTSTTAVALWPGFGDPNPHCSTPEMWSSSVKGTQGAGGRREGRNRKTRGTGARHRLSVRVSAGATPRGVLSKSGVPRPRNRPQESEEPSTLASPLCSRPWVLLGAPSIIGGCQWAGVLCLTASGEIQKSGGKRETRSLAQEMVKPSLCARHSGHSERLCI